LGAAASDKDALGGLRGSETQDGCSEEIPEGGQCHRRHLENAHAGGAEIPEAGRTGEADSSPPQLWLRQRT